MYRQTSRNKQDLALKQIIESSVRKELAKTYKWDSAANDTVVLAAIGDTSPTPPEVAKIIESLGAQGRLAKNQGWAQPFSDFYSEFPQFEFESNEAILINALIAADLGLTADNLAYVAGMSDVRGRLAVAQWYVNQQREERAAEAQAAKDVTDKEEIAATLLQWYETSQAPLYANNKYAWQDVLRRESQRLVSMSADELRTESAARNERRRIRGLSPKEYRAEVSASRTQPVEEPTASERPRYSQYEQLPEVYTARSGREVPMTWLGLTSLSRRDPFDFREVVRRFGMEAVNAILATSAAGE